MQVQQSDFYCFTLLSASDGMTKFCNSLHYEATCTLFPKDSLSSPKHLYFTWLSVLPESSFSSWRCQTQYVIAEIKGKAQLVNIQPIQSINSQVFPAVNDLQHDREMALLHCKFWN